MTRRKRNPQAALFQGGEVCLTCSGCAFRMRTHIIDNLVREYDRHNCRDHDYDD